MIGYLQFKSTRGDCFLTQSVEVKHEYGDRYLVFYEGRWRRVHIQVKRTFIIFQNEKVTIQIEGV